MSRLSHTELAAAHGRADWTLLWQHAIPLVKLTVGRMARGESIRREDADDDLLQEGMLIAGKAMRTWDPIECAYSTHITVNVRSDLIAYQQKKPNGGIGGKDQSPVMLSTSDTREDARPAADDDDGDDSGDDGTFEAHLTYDGVVKRGGQRDGEGYAPEGYGSPEEEADQQRQDAVIRTLVDDLRDSAERDAVICVYGLNGSVEHPEVYAKRIGVTRRTVSNWLESARRKLSAKIDNAHS